MDSDHTSLLNGILLSFRITPVARLTEYGGQAALNAAVCGNVDATFACLAALDNADVVSAYARFNCTVRYNAAGDEYIVVVLYG